MECQQLSQQVAEVSKQQMEAEQQCGKLQELLEQAQMQGGDVAREMAGLQQQLGDMQEAQDSLTKQVTTSWPLGCRKVMLPAQEIPAKGIDVE